MIQQPELNQVIIGNCLEVLKRFPAGMVHAVILGLESPSEVWYNNCAETNRSPGVLLLNAINSTQYFIVGKAPSLCGLASGYSSQQRWQAQGGRFIMRDKLGRFLKGFRSSPATELKKGQHWRDPKPYWDKEWLYQEYVVKQRSASDIAKEQGCTETNILIFLRKHQIPARTISEARDIKHWGLSGGDNPMFGRTGEDNHNWKGGVAPERQRFYSSLEWKSAEKAVLSRDKEVCQRCGKKGERGRKLHIHHITPFEVVESRANPDNLIMLCSTCHGWVHSKENTQKEFINE